MTATQAEPNSDAAIPSNPSPWRIAGWGAVGVIVISVSLCVILAAIRSTGLTSITVTALDPAAEPRDHELPFFKQKEALPDYRLILLLNRGDQVRLGSKPDTSAADGLTWQLSDPVSLADITTVRLEDQDKLLSDTLAEVEVLDDVVVEQGYRFEFTSQRSLTVGIQSFFRTPIGQAIAAGFCIAVILIVASAIYA
ncbi:hypothetical protein [Symmachiella dynata]|uniref:hypothetical protein n=1 Tax=Symmachiella dynata TaxID=2527995 RepID=UPI0030EC9E92